MCEYNWSLYQVFLESYQKEVALKLDDLLKFKEPQCLKKANQNKPETKQKSFKV